MSTCSSLKTERPVTFRQKLIAWLCISLQLLPSLGCLAVLPAMAEGKNPEQVNEQPVDAATQAPGSNPFEQSIAGGAMTLGTALADEDRSSSEALSDYARSQAGSLMNSTVEGWLRQFGTVRSQINLNDDFSLSDSSLDWLVPLYDSPQNILFAQLGTRHKEDRNTVNMGMGIRHFPTSDLMYGFNTFFDNDLTGKNYRLGVGGELWTNYLQLSSNVYQRLNSWHQSLDFEDYDERPANGFDLRVNGFLPAYPQLGGKMIYEQYFGDEVALFGKDDRQTDPYAVTLGMNYTPIPVMTVGAEQRMGKSGKNDFSINMDFSYQLDKSWDENTSPDAVDALRQLSHSRYDLVDRNNDIILEYRKQQVIKLHLSDDSIKGQGNSTKSVTARITSKHDLDAVAWQGGSFIAAGGAIGVQDKTHFALTLPKYQIAQMAQASKKSLKSVSGDAGRLLNTYVLFAVAKDVKGNESVPAQLTVEVLPSLAHFAGDATVVDNYAPPDGATPVFVIFSIVDDNNSPLVNEPVTFVVTLPDGTSENHVIKSDGKGTATLPVTSSSPGESTVVASLDSGDSSTVKVHFTDAQPNGKHSTLVAYPASILANDRDSSMLTLSLNDVLNRPLGGLGDSIELTAAGVDNLDIGRVKENSEGVYKAPMSGTSTGIATLGVKIDGKVLDGVSAQVTLTGDSDSAHINSSDMAVIVNNRAADGKTANQVQVKVVDDNNIPVVGEHVAFSVDNNAKVTASDITDGNGIVVASVTSMLMGDASVTATVNGASQSKTVTFIADDGTATLLAGSLKAVIDGAVANGDSSNQVQATVTDEGDNPVAGASVTFTATNGATFSMAEVETDKNGKATAYSQNTTIGLAVVTATVNGHSQSIDTHFIANKATANGELKVLKNHATADGRSTNEIQLLVVDARNNPVSGVKLVATASDDVIFEHESGVTDEYGLARTTLTSKKAGTTLVTVKAANGETLSERVTFTANSDSATLLAGDLTILTDGAVANGLASNRVQAKIIDANGNPVGDFSVDFTATNGAIGDARVKTDANGLAVLALKSTHVGTSTVTATANGISQHADVHFIADKSTGRGELTADDRHAIANGIETNGVKLTLKDANDNPLSGVEVAFSASNDATLKTESGATDENGELSIDITSIKAGRSIITAKVASGETRTAEVNFIADSSNATILAGNMTVTRDNAVANKRSSNLVKVAVTDGNGNPVTNQNVTFSAGNHAIITESATTDASGIITVALINDVAGTSNVTATLNDSTSNIDTHFVADKSTASGTLVTIDDNRIANGIATNSVKLTIKDARNNPVPGMDITFSAADGVALGTAAGQTDTNGELTTTLTSEKAFTSKVTARASNGENASTNITFVADDATAKLLDNSLNVISDNATANGNARNIVETIVADAYGNPVKDVSVDFTAANGAVITSPAVTDSSGTARTWLSNTTAGISHVTATVKNSNLGVDTNFNADKTTAHGIIAAIRDDAVANGSDMDSVLVTLTDGFDNPLADVTVTFSATQGVKAVAPAGKTDASGKITATFTSTQAVSSNITARTSNGATLSIPVKFIADESTATIISGNLTVISNHAVANDSASNRVKILVTDAFNNPLPRVKVSLTASNGAAIATDVATGNNGQSIVSLQNTVAGISKVTATINGHSQSVDTFFEADRSTGNGILTVDKDNAVADGNDSNRVVLTLTDANNNPLPDVAVTFSATQSINVLTPAGKTDANGQLSTQLSSTQAITSTISARAANGETLSQPVVFIADADTATLIAGNLTVLDDYALANGTSSNRVRAKVTDAKGNPVPDMDVTFAAGNGGILSTPVKTDNKGEAIASLQNTRMGISPVTATVKGISQKVDTHFIADASTASGMLKTMDNNAVADGSDTNSAELTLVDANNNPLADIVVTFTATNGVKVLAPSGKTDASGKITTLITSTAATTSTVIARAANGETLRDEMIFIADDSTAAIATGNLTLLDDNALANGSASNRVQAKVTDALGNPVPNMTVTFAAGNGASITTSSTTSQYGIAVASLQNTVAGVSQVTATANATSQQLDTHFVADAATASGRLVAVDGEAIANGTDTAEVQLTLTDANNNPLPDISVTFSASNGVSVTTTSGKTNGNGQLSTTLTSLLAAKSIVTAKVDNGETLTANVTFNADDSSAVIVVGNMTILTDGAVANGTGRNEVQVKVTDANGNPIPATAVSFCADNGANIVTSAETDSVGIIRLPVTSLKAGTSKVTASINNNSQFVTLNFVADSDTAQILDGALSTVDNNAIADGATTNSVKAIVTDANNNRVPDAQVTFRADNGASIAGSATTDANGEVIATLTNTNAGISNVTATAASGSRSVSSNFTADENTARIVSGGITVIANNAPTDGLSSNRVGVAVIDQFNNPVPNQTVHLSATNGAHIAESAQTNVQGWLEAPLTSTTAGDSIVTASINGSDQPVLVTFTADGDSAKIADGALKMTVDNAVANGTTMNTVQATVTDGSGNPVDGAEVTFDADNGATISASGTTDTEGTVSVTMTSTTAGISKVTATVNGGTQSVDATFMADEKTANIVAGALTVIADNATANGIAVNRIQAMVTDGHNNPVPGVAVAFSASNTAKIAATGTTDAQGVVRQTITSTKSGISNITATVSGGSQNVDTTFVADRSTAVILSLETTQDDALANGSATNEVQATVTDAYNNLVPDQTVTFIASNGAVIIASAPTDMDGHATVTLTSEVAGISVVTASGNGSDRAVNTRFKADENSAEITSSNMAVTKNNALADGSEINRVRVIVTDQHGNPVPDAVVAFAADNGAVIAPTSTTDGQGRIVMPLTSTTAGLSNVTATINTRSQSLPVTFTADIGTAKLAGLTLERDGAVADGAATNEVKTVVVDRNNNPIPQMDVSFLASNGAVIAAAGTTDANGIVIMTLTSTLAGDSDVTAVVNGDARYVTTHFIADERSAEIAEENLTVTRDGAAADGTASNRVRVNVTDANGNPVTDAEVTFSATNGAKISGTGKTNANGIITLPVTSTTAGVSTVTASILGSTPSVDVNFVADTGSAHIASFITEIDGAVANGSATNRVKAHVVDGNNNPVTNMKVALAANNSASIATSGTTDTNGDVVMTVTSTRAGMAKVTAQVNGNAELTDVSFIADDSTAEIVSGALRVTADRATANGSTQNRVEVAVTDAFGNALENQIVNFTADNSALIAETGITNASGKVELKMVSTVAGISQVTATIGTSSQNVNVIFIADGSTAGIAEGALTMVDDGAIANGVATNSVQALVEDAKGNPVAHQTVEFFASHGATIAASGQTDTSGKVLVTLTSKIAGISTIMATVNGASRETGATFVADSATARIADENLSVTRNYAKADGVTSNRVQVDVTDANGNPLAEVVVAFTADNGAVIDTSGTTDRNGRVTQSLTSTIAGISSVTASINGSSQSVPVTFVADTTTATLVSLDVETNNALANGIATDSVKAVVMDGHGNRVADMPISFATDNNALIAASGTTDVNGEVIATLTNETAGTSNVRASVNGHELWQAVNFKADEASAQIVTGNMTVTRDNALADGQETNRVFVSVTDAKGNAIANQTVNFEATNGATLAASGKTDDSGVMTLPVTSRIAGPSIVTASINGSSQSVEIMFKADSNTADILDGALVMIDDGAVADGIATNKVQARVTDAFGNLVKQTSVSFSANNGATIEATGITNDNGQVAVTLTSETSGISQITATVSGGSNKIDATFVADGSSAEILADNIKVTKDNALANNAEFNKVSVRVTDGKNNPVPDFEVNFIADNSAIVTATGKTNANGEIDMPVTSTVAGTSNVTASIKGSSRTLPVTFIADTNTAQVTSLEIITNNAVADGTSTNNLKATVKDAHGNRIPNISIHFLADNNAVIAPSEKTDGNGEATVTLTNKTAGMSNILAEVNGYEQWTGVTFIADKDSAEIVAGDMKVTKNFAVADGVEFNRVYVNVTDAFDNPVPDLAVNFTADNSAEIAATANTDGEGMISLPITSIVAGVSTITASINGKSQSVPVTFEPDETTAKIAPSDLILLKDGALSDGKDQNQIQAIVKDAMGNLVPGVPVNFTASNGAIIAAKAVSNEQGIVTQNVISTKSGISQVVASINDSHPGIDVMFIAATIPMITLVKDNTGTITGVLTSGQVTDAAAPLLSGTADENAFIRLYDGGKLIGNTVSDSEGKWTVAPSSALTIQGKHQLTLKGALTKEGEESEPSEVFILDLDNIAEIPVITNVADSNGDVPKGATTNWSGLILTGTAEPDSSVDIILQNEAHRLMTKVGTTKANASGQWSLSVKKNAAMQDTGDYNFLVTMTDIAGNSSSVSRSAPWTIEHINWPAPDDAVVYMPESNDETITASKITAIMGSAENLLINSTTANWARTITLPTASANKGKTVYLSIQGRNSGLKINGGNVILLPAGSESAYYATASQWEKVH